MSWSEFTLMIIIVTIIYYGCNIIYDLFLNKKNKLNYTEEYAIPVEEEEEVINVEREIEEVYEEGEKNEEEIELAPGVDEEDITNVINFEEGEGIKIDDLQNIEKEEFAKTDFSVIK